MKIASIANVKAQFSTYVKACAEGPIVITKNGKPKAVLLAVEHESELERLVLAYSPRFRGILAAARKQIHETGGVPHDEFWHDIETDTK